MNMEGAKQAFYEESDELLQVIENALLAVEGSSGDQYSDHVNALFRAAHTIKGSAGLFDFREIVAFTHEMESLLDHLRSGQLRCETGLVELLFACRDHIAAQVSAIREGMVIPADAAIMQRLRDYREGRLNQAPSLSRSSRQVEIEEPGEHVVSSDYWHLSLRFGPEVLRNGMDPLSFIRYLAQLGRIVYLTTLYDNLPPPDELDTEVCYLGFEIEFEAVCDKQTIENVFEFVRDDSTIRILPPHSTIAKYIQLIADLPEGSARLGEILVRGGALTEAELAEVLGIQKQRAEAGSPQPLGAILVEQQLAPAQAVMAALDKQKQNEAQQKQQEAQQKREHKVVKVDAGRLDELINLVGELVIASAATQLAADRAGINSLAESVNILTGLVERVRDEALSLRMVPIGDIFGRFPRVVRDASRELNKAIELEMSGAETELDKSMVDKLGDPLTHLVRNAIDHGIEQTERRIACGKQAHGTVWLNAYHESGSVVIEVGDDGGGMNRDKIRARAIQRGLLAADAVLDDDEILQLIFEPGFSTADQISNLSGRGVGMDVVKRNIEALKGKIELDSIEGEGTIIRMRLPLTLAIIDGFQVGVASANFVIPLDLVIECLDLRNEDILQGRNFLNLRGEVLPYLRLRDAFELEGEPSVRESVVVVQYGQERAGLVVDSLQGELQAVIKPLGLLFRGLRGLGGSTILGNGAVALIVDVPELIQLARGAERRRLLPSSPVDKLLERKL